MIIFLPKNIILERLPSLFDIDLFSLNLDRNQIFPRLSYIFHHSLNVCK